MASIAEKRDVPMLASLQDLQEHLAKPGLHVYDVYSKWAGPCDVLTPFFRKWKTEHGEMLSYAQVNLDAIEPLAPLKNKSSPQFLFYHNGILVHFVKGANSPAIEKAISENITHLNNGSALSPLVLPGIGDLNVAGASTAPEPKVVDGNASESNTALDSSDPSALVEKTIALIKPDGMVPSITEEILNTIKRQRFHIVKMRKLWLNKDNVLVLYHEYQNEAWIGPVVNYLTCAPVLALQLAKDNAIHEWRDLIGPANSIRARKDFPSTIRGLFGTDNKLNVVYGSDSKNAVENDTALFFGPDVHEIPIQTHDLTNVTNSVQKTLALIKPDAVNSDKVDEIIERIVNHGFQVVKREECILSPERAAELYTHQKEKPYFQDAVKFLSSGPLVALVLKGDDVIRLWREMIGRTNPEKAKADKPMCLRALYGTDSVRNAVHGSDSVDNALREINILFPNILVRNNSAIFKSTMNISPSANDQSPAVDKFAALITVDGVEQKDAIFQRLASEGLKVVSKAHMTLNQDSIQQFYSEVKGESYFDELCVHAGSGSVIAIILEKENGLKTWVDMAGPLDIGKAKADFPLSLRAQFATSNVKHAIYTPESPDHAKNGLKLVTELIQKAKHSSIVADESLNTAAPPTATESPKVSSKPASRATSATRTSLAGALFGGMKSKGSKSSLEKLADAPPPPEPAPKSSDIPAPALVSRPVSVKAESVKEVREKPKTPVTPKPSSAAGPSPKSLTGSKSALTGPTVNKSNNDIKAASKVASKLGSKASLSAAEASSKPGSPKPAAGSKVGSKASLFKKSASKESLTAA